MADATHKKEAVVFVGGRGHKQEAAGFEGVCDCHQWSSEGGTGQGVGLVRFCGGPGKAP